VPVLLSRPQPPTTQKTSPPSSIQHQQHTNTTITMSKPSSRYPKRQRARIGRKHLLVEDHYRVDPVDKRLLPGLPVNDEDWARDLHDFFNLIALVSLFIKFRCARIFYLMLSFVLPNVQIPVVVLNAMNWNWVRCIFSSMSNNELSSCV
jgi:hypothetical protein